MRVRYRALLGSVVLVAAAAAALSAFGAGGTSYTSTDGPVSLPDRGGSASPASVYPTTITVSGNPGVVSHATVTLNGFTHTCPSDLNILLVAPNGSTSILGAQEGPCDEINGDQVTFDDSASTSWANADSAVAGASYRPAAADPTIPGTGNCDWPGSLINPGPPSGPYGSDLAAVNGSPANGTWKLYIEDNCAIDTGVLASWTLHLTTGGSTRVEDSIFLCYSKFQVDPGVWSMSIAKSLLKEGDYWLPYAVAGNPLGSHTILGNYSLACNVPGTYVDTGQAVDGGGTAWGTAYVQDHIASQGSLIGLYELFAAPSS